MMRLVTISFSLVINYLTFHILLSNYYSATFVFKSNAPTNNSLLQPTGDGGHDGRDVAGEGRGGRDEASPAGLRQGRQGEADERVSPPPPPHLC